jgi:hypothetical protein
MGGWARRLLIGATLTGCDGADPAQRFDDAGGPSTPQTGNLFVDEVPATTCLPRPLVTQPDGSVECKMIEVRVVDAGGQCTACESNAGRAAVSDNLAEPVRQRLEALARCGGITGRNCSGPSAAAAGHCQCGLRQLSGDDAAACRSDPAPIVSGWCYVDPANGLGDPALVASCSGPAPKMVRFVGSAAREDGVSVFIACTGIAAR